jgi:hypothetical protein
LWGEEVEFWVFLVSSTRKDALYSLQTNNIITAAFVCQRLQGTINRKAAAAPAAAWMLQRQY